MHDLQHREGLVWPDGRPRHWPVRGKPSLWKHDGRPITLGGAIARVTRQLQILDVRRAVLGTNVPLRRDGQPRAGFEPDDPGAVLDFIIGGRNTVLACDKWAGVAANVAALAAHIEALRGQERWGVGSIEQAFAGYAALPPPETGHWTSLLDHPKTLEDAEASFRRKMRTAHPDAGGSDAAAALLNVAIARARRELT